MSIVNAISNYKIKYLDLLYLHGSSLQDNHHLKYWHREFFYSFFDAPRHPPSYRHYLLFFHHHVILPNLRLQGLPDHLNPLLLHHNHRHHHRLLLHQYLNLLNEFVYLPFFMLS